MRVLIDALPVTNVSGTGYYVQKLVAALAHAPSDHTFIVVTPPLDRTAFDTTPWPGGSRVQLVSTAPARPALQSAWRQWRLAQLTRRYRADLVHYPAFIGCLRCETRSVVTIPDLVWRRYRETVPRRKRQYYDHVIPRSMERARRIITISDATLTDLRQEYPQFADKAATVHLGVDRHVFRPRTEPTLIAAVRKRYNLPQEFILALSTLEPRKNMAALVRAFTLLERDLPDTHLVLAGKAGYQADRLRAIAAASPRHARIHFPGHIAPADLPVVYSIASTFALPSLSEGFGLPILEAMACGLPVVTSDRSAMREVADGAAELVNPEAPEAIAAGLRRVVLEPETRKRRRDGGMQRVAAFSWDRCAAETIGVYEDAAG